MNVWLDFFYLLNLYKQIFILFNVVVIKRA